MWHCQELDFKVRKCLTLHCVACIVLRGMKESSAFPVSRSTLFPSFKSLDTCPSLIDRGDKAINANPLIARENGVQRKVIASLENFTSTVNTS